MDLQSIELQLLPSDSEMSDEELEMLEENEECTDPPSVKSPQCKETTPKADAAKKVQEVLKKRTNSSTKVSSTGSKKMKRNDDDEEEDKELIARREYRALELRKAKKREEEARELLVKSRQRLAEASAVALVETCTK